MKLVTLVIFLGTVQTYYGTPIHLFRRVFISFRAFQQHLAALRDYFRFVRNSDTLFENATQEQLAENRSSACWTLV